MTKRGPFSTLARLKSFSYAFKGIGELARTEHSFWIQIASAGAVIGLGLTLQISQTEWLWLILAIGGVLSAEAMNTAVERLCDVVSPDHNEMIGTAKDIAAGAVLINACAAALICAVIFLPHLLSKWPL